MTVWICGSSGMLGGYVERILIAKAIPSIGSNSEVDIADGDAVASFAKEHRVSAIVNCAAYTAVDAAETDEVSAMRTNGLGPVILAELARTIGARYVHISTDYVFSGEGSGDYGENAEVGPCNVYGKSKLVGENGICRVMNAETVGRSGIIWYILRTSWLFGLGGSSFVETMWKLMLEKAELRVVNDQHGRPTYAEDLAQFVVNSLVRPNNDFLPFGTWHFANRNSTTWFEFAAEIRQLMLVSGQRVTVKRILPVTSEEFSRAAKRPKNSVLSTARLEAFGIIPRDWRAALREFIRGRAAQ